jgi:hypothetical protein
MSFDHNIALTGQHLIEASAGTGKTAPAYNPLFETCLGPRHL